MVAKTGSTSSPVITGMIIKTGMDSCWLRASIAFVQCESNHRSVNMLEKTAGNLPENIPENIVMIGPMGSGKTTIGRRLADMLGKQFVDCDQTLEQRLGVNISLIFDLEGEEGFRHREHLMLKELCLQKNIVLATGGGSILRPENRELLRRFGTVVYLETSVKQQISRLERDKARPLLQRPDREEHLYKLAEQRNPLYSEIADITVKARDLPVEQMAQHTLSILQQQFESSQCPL